jgi:hypothetical protein
MESVSAPKCPLMPAGSGAVIIAPSAVCQRSQRKFTTCGWIIKSCTT